MWQSSADAVRATDEVSFFVRGQVFNTLSAAEILGHDAGHINNALSKINCVTDGELHRVPADFAVLQDEVVPDLFIYGVQLANAYGYDPAGAYAAAAHLPTDVVAAVTSEAELVRLQHDSDNKVLPDVLRVDGEVDPLRLLAYERFSLSAHALAVTRIADKADHGVVVGAEAIVFDAAGRLLLSAVRIADACDANLGCAVAVRLVQIREKYGTPTGAVPA